MTQTEKLPLITAGITCFNAADTIARAIDSALRQDWENLEVVIIDDCSTDNSNAVIQDAIKGHANARLVTHEHNKGFAGALNTLIGEAKGEFIAIFDDDDVSEPSRLSVQYKTLTTYEQEHNPPLAACYASGQRQYPNGYVFYFDAIGSRPDVPVGEDMVRYHLFAPRPKNVFYGNGTPSCNLMLRKSVYAEIGMYDPLLRRTEDCDFAIRLGKKGGHFVGCPERLVTQYPSDGMDKKPKKNYESDLTLIEKYRDDLMRLDRYEYAHYWTKIKYHHFAGEPYRAMKTFVRLMCHYPLTAIGHMFQSAPRRLIHEWKMRMEKFE